ncbi:delta(14)-sterol reductase Erg24p [Trichomonascus vanleenenianus]|uniref:delta(14)-sterol reductase n=1 Tax=Trichomonascus vanleenenianus TaxID=2268995 RepID=UPI003ECA394C
MSKLNPKTAEPDFGGAPGALAISIGLPVLFNVLYFSCNEGGCPREWSVQMILDQLKTAKLVSWEATAAYAAWFAGLVVLDRILPGKEVKGVTLRDGTQLTYKFNGKVLMMVLLAIFSQRLVDTKGMLPELVFVYDHMLELTNVAIIFSFVLACFVYIRSFLHKKEVLLAEGGNTGNPIFDWFIGRELNPRIGDFDIKVFCEMRPGLLLWVLINMAMAHHQILKYGALSNSMALVLVFQTYYVVEGTFYEEGLIQMIDVTTDGFGFMLSLGDLALVPFTHTMQARYLADHPGDIPWIGFAACLGVFLLGLYIFRMANNEKSAFKRGDPLTAHLKYIETPTGSKLITSGWWGMSRHINYFGDWLVAWAYCLPCGFQTPIPYYFVVWFGILLIHREIRDDAKCAKKYKETWTKYKKLVPYRIIPGIY